MIIVSPVKAGKLNKFAILNDLNIPKTLILSYIPEENENFFANFDSLLIKKLNSAVYWPGA